MELVMADEQIGPDACRRLIETLNKTADDDRFTVADGL